MKRFFITYLLLYLALSIFGNSTTRALRNAALATGVKAITTPVVIPVVNTPAIQHPIRNGRIPNYTIPDLSSISKTPFTYSFQNTALHKSLISDPWHYARLLNPNFDQLFQITQALRQTCSIDDIEFCHVNIPFNSQNARFVASISCRDGKISQQTILNDSNYIALGRGKILTNDFIRKRLPITQIKQDSIYAHYICYSDYDDIFVNMFPRTNFSEYPSKQAINYIVFYSSGVMACNVLFVRATQEMQSEEDWTKFQTNIMQAIIAYIRHSKYTY